MGFVQRKGHEVGSGGVTGCQDEREAWAPLLHRAGWEAVGLHCSKAERAQTSGKCLRAAGQLHRGGGESSLLEMPGRAWLVVSLGWGGNPETYTGAGGWTGGPGSPWLHCSPLPAINPRHSTILSISPPKQRDLLLP